VAPKKRPDVVPTDSQLTALGKRSQDEVEEVTEKDSSSSSQRKRPTKANPYATAAKFVDFAELFKSPKASEVATPAGEPFCKAISKLGVKSLELPAKAFVVCPCNGRTYNDLVQYQEHCLNDSEHLDTEQQLECVPCARVFASRKDYFNHLKSSPSHEGNVKFAKALLDLSRASDANPGLTHPVLPSKPDFSVGQAIQELKEIKDTIKNPFRSAPPAAK
jgi:uncharacterized C2H2 Zn-finger protein